MFGLAVASALVPLINIEAILVLAASEGQVPAWLLVVGATVGQMLGKLLWYYGGRELDRRTWDEMPTTSGRMLIGR